MEEKLVELKSAMDAEERINTEIAEERAKFEKEHETLFLQQVRIREKISGCKEILWKDAEEGYTKDGNKQRLGGLGIRIMTNLEYDADEAFKWAEEHSLCLKLDELAFKKVAKTQDIDFVTKSEKITVTFPKEIVIGEDIK